MSAPQFSIFLLVHVVLLGSTSLVFLATPTSIIHTVLRICIASLQLLRYERSKRLTASPRRFLLPLVWYSVTCFSLLSYVYHAYRFTSLHFVTTVAKIWRLQKTYGTTTSIRSPRVVFSELTPLSLLAFLRLLCTLLLACIASVGML